MASYIQPTERDWYNRPRHIRRGYKPAFPIDQALPWDAYRFSGNTGTGVHRSEVKPSILRDWRNMSTMDMF